MPHQELRYVNHRTLSLIRLKILCYLVHHALIVTLLLSFVVEGIAAFFALWDHGPWAILFGLYCTLTGISTAGLASWRANADMMKTRATSSASAAPATFTGRRWGYVVCGTIFLLEGLLFLVLGVGRILDWLPPHQFFASTGGRIALLALLILPFALGSSAMTAVSVGGNAHAARRDLGQ